MRVPALLLAVAGSALSLAASAGADTLTLTDGRVVEGSVEKYRDVYRVTSRFGVAELPAKDVAAWTKGETFEAEWRRRADALAADDHAGRAALAKRLVDAGRADEGRALAETVVDADPENAAAHAILGHVRHRGTYKTPDEARLADGLERHGDTWYTPEEWALVDATHKAKATDADRLAASRAVGVRANAAVRLMLAPDKALRAEGEKRLVALAAETGSASMETLVGQVRELAAANDRLVAAATTSLTRTEIERATALTECRIQLAKLKRPIQSFTTGLGSNLAGAGVTIQLPEIELIKVGTTVGIPVR